MNITKRGIVSVLIVHIICSIFYSYIYLLAALGTLGMLYMTSDESKSTEKTNDMRKM